MPVRLLLADASPQVRRVLRFVFEQDARFAVVGETSTGREVVDRASGVDVIVTDIELEDLDGLTALVEVRRDHPGVAVVVHSALTQPFFRAEAAARGAAAFVAKGAGADEVVDAVVAAAGSAAAPA